MAGTKSLLGRAAVMHRRAVALAAAVDVVLGRQVPQPRSDADERALQKLAEELRVAGARVAPGWLGSGLDATPANSPLGSPDRPRFVRVGTALPQPDASFPAVVPLGHIAMDADAQDPRVAGLLQSVLLRLLAAAPAGSLLVRAVDPTGTVFAAFAALHDAGIMPPPALDLTGMRTVLTEAEQWVRAGGSPTRTLLLVLTAWPPETDETELARWSALATAGPAAGTQLLLASWPPPPPLGPIVPAAPLPHTAQLRLRAPYAYLGHPPDGSSAAPVTAGETAPPGLTGRIRLDPAPAPALVTQVCRRLAATVHDRTPVRLADLLPDRQLRTGDATAGLTVPLGRAGDAPVLLRLDKLTPHWLVAGRARSGKTSLLCWLIYSLCARYGADQLSCFLLDLTGKRGFIDFLPTANHRSRLPQVAVVGLEPDQERALTALRSLVLLLVERSEGRRGGSYRAARAAGAALPRVLCLVDEYQPLLRCREGAKLLELLLRQGGECGIHLVLASADPPAGQTRYGDPDSAFGQCRVRIALPGGSHVLDPANDAAAGLPLGFAVVNTAGGLGGPRGATRAHEQILRFPDPYADPVSLAGLRHRLRQGRA